MKESDDELFLDEHARVYRETGGQRGYHEEYQQRTERQIPVVILERA